MVKELDASGMHLRAFTTRVRIPRESLTGISLADPNLESRQSRKELLLSRLAKLSVYDRKSFLIKNVYHNGRWTRDVLLIPRDCPHLEQSLGDLPPEGKTFVVDTWRRSNSRMILQILTIKDSPPEAGEYVKGVGAKILGCQEWEVSVEPKLITPTAFMARARWEIDKGAHLPIEIMRYGDLIEYQRKKFGRAPTKRELRKR